jgi:uncharacterized membrane protein (UPF0127 family)
MQLGRSRWLPLAAAALLAGCGVWGCGPEPVKFVPHPKVAEGAQQTPRSAELQVAGRTIHVELAYTDAARTRGLMARTGLEPDNGMLFLFTDEKPRRFWMRDTLIGLDIAFLDETGRVLNIEQGRPGVEVPGYRSSGPARFVLEMAEGWCEEAGLGPGDRIEIPGSLRELAEPGG